MPLHASTTESVCLESSSTLPFRSTGICQDVQRHLRRAAGNQLQREGDAGVDDGGNRNHEQQQEQRKRQRACKAFAAHEQDQADQREQKGGPR